MQNYGGVPLAPSSSEQALRYSAKGNKRCYNHLVLKIITAPNPILSQTTKPCTIRYGAKSVSKINADILRLIEEMKESLLAAEDPEGVGLAAPQVGHPLQLFITKPTPKFPIQIFINPKIASKTEISHLTIDDGRRNKLNKPLENPGRKSQTKLEGCLSLPDIWGEVKRNPSITLSYLDEKGYSHTRTFKGLSATIVQHEIDHLNGILFPKKVLEQKGKLYKSHKDEKGEDVFEEIEI
jgi:peptide deformylase